MMIQSGIYRIIVRRHGKRPKFYVGQASNLEYRRKCHLRRLRAGKHENFKLQRAWSKYGECSFEFEIVELCEADRKILAEREQLTIDSYCQDQLYNIRIICTTSNLGMKLSPETKQAMSASRTGRKHSKQHCSAISDALKTRGIKPPSTPAHMEKLRQLSVGRKRTPEQIEATASAKRGKPKSAADIRKRNETRRANAEARGFWASPETVARRIATKAAVRAERRAIETQ